MAEPSFPPNIDALPANIKVLATLFSTLAQNIFRFINTESSDLTPLNSLIVCTVACHPGIAMSDLADQLGIAKSQLSRNVLTLEKLDLVERRHNTDNRRLVYVYANPAGNAMAQAQVLKVAQHLNGLLDKLEAPEQQRLDVLLSETLAILAKADIVPIPVEQLKTAALQRQSK